MFLQAVDTVLAFSMIMLLLSVLVTVLVQMFISLFGLRGHNLLFGLRQLVGTVAPELEKADVNALVEKVFQHPALSAGGKRTSVEVDAKEVLMVLDAIRKGADLEPRIKATLDQLFESAASESSKLAASLQLLNGLRTVLPDDIEAVQKATDKALDGAREIVVRIDTWFDSAMKHSSERLKLHARWITGFCAVVFTVGLQVDTVSILNQLWTDPAVTTQFVVDAQGALELYEKSQEAANMQEQKEVVDQIRATLGETDLTIFQTLAAWEHGHSKPSGSGKDSAAGEASKKDGVWSWTFFPGSLLSALLLSLGAPFWYGVVGKIVGFRSAVAGKAKEQKA